MAVRKELRVKCPGCGKVLLVDVATGHVLREEDRKVDESTFGEALAKVKRRAEEADQLFSRALESEEERKKRLEDVFREAQKRAAENPEEKPFNPMDLD